MTWSLSRTAQCAKCPWRKQTNPYEIPDGYSVELHQGLERTISDPVNPSAISSSITAMACHESSDQNPEMCTGWIVQQAGVGNNISLRLLLMSCLNTNEIETFGDQHNNFQDTLPSIPEY